MSIDWSKVSKRPNFSNNQEFFRKCLLWWIVLTILSVNILFPILLYCCVVLRHCHDSKAWIQFSTDYKHPVRKSPKLHCRKSTTTPKCLGTERSIFCLPYRPKFSDFFDLHLHWLSVVRAILNCPCMYHVEVVYT